MLSGDANAGAPPRESAAIANEHKSSEALNDHDEHAPLHTDERRWTLRVTDVLITFAPLGFIAFGGPAAHIAILRERFVTRLKWTDDQTFTELFGLCQALPGPTSTQLVVALASVHAGMPAGLLAFAMWSLPNFVVLTVLGVVSGQYLTGTPTWMAGIGPAATAMVFYAAYQFSKPMVASRVKMACAVFACMATLLVLGDARVSPQLGSVSFPATLVVGGLATWADSKRPDRLAQYWTPLPNEPDARAAAEEEHARMMRRINIPRAVGVVIILTWLAVIVLVEVLRGLGFITTGLPYLFQTMYRIGSIIYGGGHVVLPMMENFDYCSTTQFLVGTSIALALPGPLFGLSAYLGGVYAGLPGSFVGYVALNLPGLILIFGALPYWAHLRRSPNFKAVLAGVSSAGVGLIYTACIQLWVQSVVNSAGAVVFVASGAAVSVFNVPVPAAIIGGIVLGVILSDVAIGVAQTPFCAVAAGLNSTGR